MDKISVAQQNGAPAMARYKPYDLNQAKMIPLSYADQIVEGSFEHALNEIVEEHLDLTVFEKALCQRRDGATGVRSAGAAQGGPVRLLQGHPFEPDAGGGVPAERGVHGAVGGHAAALYDAGWIRKFARP